jgi:hypothetical protein
LASVHDAAWREKLIERAMKERWTCAPLERAIGRAPGRRADRGQGRRAFDGTRRGMIEKIRKLAAAFDRLHGQIQSQDDGEFFRGLPAAMKQRLKAVQQAMEGLTGK